MNAERGMPRLLALVLAASILAGPLEAQQTDSLVRPASPALVKYGKWALVAAAIGMGMKASQSHHDADRAFNRLNSYCSAQPAGCPQSPDGKYLDPVAERYYQQSLAGDRSARNWLLGGEGALLGAGALFVWELTRPRHRPKNIPFEPEFQVLPGGSRIGMRMEF